MDMVMKGYEDLAQIALNKGMTLDEALKFYYKSSPGFREDEMFKNMFPCYYGIALCKKELAKKEEYSRYLDNAHIN